MTDCGVNLFGFDPLLPEDGRIQATVWSWAPDEPRAGAGACTVQGAAGRWSATACAEEHRAACLVGETWTLTAGPVPFADATAACAGIGGGSRSRAPVGRTLCCTRSPVLSGEPG